MLIDSSVELCWWKYAICDQLSNFCRNFFVKYVFGLLRNIRFCPLVHRHTRHNHCIFFKIHSLVSCSILLGLLYRLFYSVGFPHSLVRISNTITKKNDYNLYTKLALACVLEPKELQTPYFDFQFLASREWIRNESDKRYTEECRAMALNQIVYLWSSLNL